MLTPELKEEYKMLLKTYKKLGGEEIYDKVIKKGKVDEALFSVRDKIRVIENQLTAKEIIECAYKFSEK